MSNAYEHRKGTAALFIKDKDGVPLKNKEIKIKQKKHKFLFGCAEFSTVEYVNGELSGEQSKYAEIRVNKLLDIFNFVTLPFYWGRFEPAPGHPDTDRIKKTAQWLTEKGCTVKGHPLCWHTSTAPWLIERNMPNDRILSLQLERIRREVYAFSGLIDIWDVINEVVIMPRFDKYDNGITRICKEYGRIGLVKKVFSEAQKTNPNALLLINDFNLSESYEILIEGLLEAGVPIGGVGLQSHMHQGWWGEERTLEILDRFSRFGLPLHFTEINLVSGQIMPKHIVDLNDYKVDEWSTTREGEERQANEAAALYKILFEHPLVEAITYWSFTDGNWLKAPAGFLTRESRVKPVYDKIHKLIKDEWWTKEHVYMTDDKGAVAVSGYKGDYTAEIDGGSFDFKIN